MSGGYTAIVIDVPSDEGIVTITRKRAPAGDGASLKFMQDAVGGYIEHLVAPSRPDLDWWMNDEGKLMGLPVNELATDLLTGLWPEWGRQDILVGPIVLTGSKPPETASVPDDVWDKLRSMTFFVTVVFVDEAAA
jgi:hypothetical protein